MIKVAFGQLPNGKEVLVVMGSPRLGIKPSFVYQRDPGGYWSPTTRETLQKFNTYLKGKAF